MYMDATLSRRPPFEAKYRPPREVVQTSVGEMLSGVRAIPATQQARLGFTNEAQTGLRVWCSGDLRLIGRPCVAIVGTREMSAEGAARARRLAAELGRAGVVVVSGLARGIDAEAMRSAIHNGGKVIGVIGTPIDKAYPAENAPLQELVYREHLLVSQFQVGSRVFRGNFPARNKLMAAISDATVIIEASDTSGTLHQAAECTRLGRWLFIAKSVVEDSKLTWPAKFTSNVKTRVLTVTNDLLAALEMVPC